MYQCIVYFSQIIEYQELDIKCEKPSGQVEMEILLAT